jgi:undecaprenyl phosphate-alpha-L-ara4FN deformylase
MIVGLRVDVDTYRGTRLGVPALVRLLEGRGIRASFFFSAGPDNMGRHVRRLLRPGFLGKILRSNAPGLYGWDILTKGLLWPGPVIARRLGPVIRSAAAAGHEIGLHAWDHHGWQAGLERMPPEAIRLHLRQGFDLLAEAAGAPPSCSAAPGWKCDDRVLMEKERFPFAYNSDCRGRSVFRPAVAGRPLAQPQVPVTLPTYDEAIGRDGVTACRFNDYLLARLKPGGLNVLAVHAESEGGLCLGLFGDFIARVLAEGGRFVPLSDLLPAPEAIPPGALVKGTVPGRDGWLAVQA